MKTVSKKLLCLLMAVFLLAAAIPFQAFATATTYTLTLKLKNASGTVDETRVISNKSSDQEVVFRDAFGVHFGDLMNNCESISFTNSGADAGTEGKFDTDTTIVGTIVYADATVNAYVTVDGNRVAGPFPVSNKKVNDNLTRQDVIGAVTYAPDGYTPTYGEFSTVKVTKNMEVEITATNVPKKVNVTFKGNGGKVNSGSELTMVADVGARLENLAKAEREGYFFTGWYDAETGGSKIDKVPASDTTVYAQWTQDCSHLTVYLLYDNNTANAKIIFQEDVAKSESVLDYLKANVKSIVEGKLAQNPGYDWNGYWYNYDNGKQLTQQDLTMSKDYIAYVNFTSQKYTITLDANGGTVNNASKTTIKNITANSTVTLPKPKKDGKKFLYWTDGVNKYEAGKSWTYNMTHDLELVAQWEDEVTVLVRFYLNGDKSEPANRVVHLREYANGDTVTQGDITKYINQYYHAKPGKNLEADGLFTDGQWKSYDPKNRVKGALSLMVDVNNPPYTYVIYVMVWNAEDGGSNSGSNSTTSTTKPVDKTNPKTGDTMLIYPAAAVMVLAAAALVTVQVVRKKKHF